MSGKNPRDMRKTIQRKQKYEEIPNKEKRLKNFD